MPLYKNGKLIITYYKDILTAIIVDNKGKAIQIFPDVKDSESLIGNIYIGRVNNIVKNINSAFIEYLPGCMGYYHLSEDADPLFAVPGRKNGPLRKGDVLLVQVCKDSVKSKEPVLSCNITLTGKYIVLMPDSPGLRFSSKFKNSAKKNEIEKRFKEHEYKDGFILRTNSQFAEVDDIFEEIDFYSRLWLMIRDCGSYQKVLTQVYKSPPSYLIGIRDGYDDIIDEIVTDKEDVYEDIHDYMDKYQPADLKKLKFHRGNFPLSTIYNFEKQINDALQKKVWLKSGGYLVIEPTEALVSIDVNTGRYISEKNAEDEFLKINLEAAKEIARQILLRNLSGIIIVDFINMKSQAYKNMLMDYMKNLLEFDPLQTTVVDMTKLNLVEITRKKGRKPLYELLRSNV